VRIKGSRAIAAIAGLGLLSWLIYRTDLRQLTGDINRLGWGLAFIIALGGLAHVVKTWAWRFTLADSRSEVSFSHMLALRLASEALGQLGFIGTVFGDGLRVSLLSGKMPAATGISSVALDRALFILSAVVTTTLGVVVALLFWPLPHRIVLAADIFAVALTLVIAAAVVAVDRRMPFISGAARAAARIAPLRSWIEKRSMAIEQLENRLLNFFHDRPGASGASIALNLVCHAAAVLEVWITLRLLGAHLGMLGALAVEALTKFINVVGGLNPGNIGTYEGGNMLIGKLFAFGGATGLALAVARRARAIFWSVAGAVCLVFLSKNPLRPDSNSSDESQDRTRAAVILADGLFGYFGPRASLPAVGKTPVLLRAILGLRKAGFGRIVVVVDPLTGGSAERALRRTRRLPHGIEWFETGHRGQTLAQLVEKLAASGVERLAFIAADRTYHPALLRNLGERAEQGDGIVLRSDSISAGACVLSISSAQAFAASVVPDAATVEQLDAWITGVHGLVEIDAPEDRWQRIRTEQERLAAERKLDRWLVKPTDGNFARFNRRISIPISRQLIRLPITPNMVSLFTLGVSFLAGLFFAMGGYPNMVMGALLGLFASILDGCDGEVARLKLQESEFGCWLETVCDYLYYLFMFAGMTIGLLRSTGSRFFLYAGCLLLLGAVLSFVTTAMQRVRLTEAGRPEQLLGNWQREAARRRSNPLLYMARHTEFIVRRCFLPYAILFFAVCHILPVAFILAAIGANVVWPVALYSYWTFPAARISAA
jgi:phosphatidylglycerophosphate synthase